MENMMPQLNLSNRAIQTAQASQQSVKTGKASQKDRFRDLLQSSSGENAPKETAVDKNVTEDKPLKSESDEKTEKKQPSDDQQKVETKNGETVKKEENTPAEEALQEAGVQMYQYLLDPMPVVVREISDEVIEVMPEAAQVSDTLLFEDSQSDGIKQQSVSGMELFTDDGAKRELSEVTDTDDVISRMPEVQTAEAVLPADSQGEKIRTQRGDEDAAQKIEMPKQSEHIEMTAVQQSGKTQEHSSGQLSREQRDDTEQTENLAYSAEHIYRQNPMQSPVQETSGMQQTVHIRANNSQELMNQLVGQLRDKISAGKQEFEIQIHPENLGRLAIKVAYAAEKVSISIVCSNAKTMETLSAGAKNIAMIMEKNLGTPTTVVVDQQEENYLEQYKDQQNSRQQEQQEQKKEEKHTSEDSQDFLQQLRLGLI